MDQVMISENDVTQNERFRRSSANEVKVHTHSRNNSMDGLAVIMSSNKCPPSPGGAVKTQPDKMADEDSVAIGNLKIDDSDSGNNNVPEDGIKPCLSPGGSSIMNGHASKEDTVDEVIEICKESSSSSQLSPVKAQKHLHFSSQNQVIQSGTNNSHSNSSVIVNNNQSNSNNSLTSERHFGQSNVSSINCEKYTSNGLPPLLLNKVNGSIREESEDEDDKKISHDVNELKSQMSLELDALQNTMLQRLEDSMPESGSFRPPSGRKAKQRHHQQPKQSWLLRLFESKLFDMSIAISYLFNSKEPGVQTYIGR